VEILRTHLIEEVLMSIVLEGTFKLQNPGAPAETAVTSRCQVLTGHTINDRPNAKSVLFHCDFYGTTADYEAGDNPLPNPFPGLGVSGQKVKELGDLAQLTLAQLGAYLLTTPEFSVEVPEDPAP
jgi:hypothetical protein